MPKYVIAYDPAAVLVPFYLNKLISGPADNIKTLATYVRRFGVRQLAAAFQLGTGPWSMLNAFLLNRANGFLIFKQCSYPKRKQACALQSALRALCSTIKNTMTKPFRGHHY